MFELFYGMYINGYYTAFFYLIVVAFCEEVIFRGYLFGKIDQEYGFWTGAIISGIFFGVIHAFLPAITNEVSVGVLFSQMLSGIGGQGILGTAFFAILYKKSGTLVVPILVHAIMNYSSFVFS